MSQTVKLFSYIKIIWVGVIPARLEYEKLVPGISNKIETYNKIIETEMKSNQCIFLNIDDIPLNGVMSDFHHLNSVGHNWLFNKIANLVSNDHL